MHDCQIQYISFDDYQSPVPVRLPARSLLRGRLRNCLIRPCVLIAIHANCFGKHSNACLVIQIVLDIFECQIHFLECIFKSEKNPHYWLKFYWSLFCILSCVCIDSWLPSLLDNSAEIFLNYLEIWNPGRFQTSCIIENAPPSKSAYPPPRIINIRAICFSKLYCFISFWRR